MRLLRWQCWSAIVAFAITLLFTLDPGPYEMAAFSFVAQPLFVVAAVGYLQQVLHDLRRKQIL